MPEMIVRLPSIESMESRGLKITVQSLRQLFAERSDGIVDGPGSIEMLVNCNQGWDENVDPLKISVSMTSRNPKARLHHQPWRDGFAADVLDMVDTHQIDETITSIEVEIIIGGKASGGVYKNTNNRPLVEWFDPWFDPPETVTLT